MGDEQESRGGANNLASGRNEIAKIADGDELGGRLREEGLVGGRAELIVRGLWI